MKKVTAITLLALSLFAPAAYGVGGDEKEQQLDVDKAAKLAAREAHRKKMREEFASFFDGTLEKYGLNPVITVTVSEEDGGGEVRCAQQ